MGENFWNYVPLIWRNSFRWEFFHSKYIKAKIDITKIFHYVWNREIILDQFYSFKRWNLPMFISRIFSFHCVFSLFVKTILVNFSASKIAILAISKALKLPELISRKFTLCLEFFVQSALANYRSSTIDILLVVF